MSPTIKWIKDDSGESWQYDPSSVSGKGDRPKKRGGVSLKRVLAAISVMAAAFFVGGFLIPFKETVVAVGTVEPLEPVYIAAPVKGVIENLSLKEGDEIKRDALLCTLWPDDSSILTAVEERELDLKNARKELEKAQKGVLAAQEELDNLLKQRDLYQSDASEIESAREMLRLAELELNRQEADYQRSRELFEAKLIAGKDMEEAESARNAAEVRLRSARANLSAAEARRRLRLQELEGKIQVATSRLETAKTDLLQKKQILVEKERQFQTAKARAARLEVRAPLSGKIVLLNAKDGDHLEPGQTIAMLARDSAKRIRIDLPAMAAEKVAVGQKVRIASRIYSHLYHGYAQGRISETKTYVRRGGPRGNLETLPVMAVVERTPFPLPLGTRVDVRIYVGKKRLLFPRSPDYERR